MEKTPFLNFFYARRRPPHPPARPIYPAGGDPSPQRTRTACTAQVARQTTSCTGTHARTLDTLHREIGTAALENVRLYVACATFLCACTFNLG